VSVDVTNTTSVLENSSKT